MTDPRPRKNRVAHSLFVALLVVASLSGQAVAAQNTPIRITADLTESARHLYHAEIDLPVQPGPLTLTTPVWIPGSHSPNGPLSNITGVRFEGAAKSIPWRRDDLVLSQFHLTIPPGVSTLHAHLDAIVTQRATRKMAMLEWETLLLYPAHTPVHEIAVEPAVTVLAGWSVASALSASGASAATPAIEPGQGPHSPPPGSTTTSYAATTVQQLEDSPVLAARYLREYTLAPELSQKHLLDLAGDEPGDTLLPPAVLTAMDDLVREAEIEYGAHHFNAYHFLVTRSDFAGGDGGLEHAQSTDIGIRRAALIDPAHTLAAASLLAHEFTHSWNGKYRRPQGLVTPDFATPVEGRLLWVYEGMTQYLGDVLAARSGLNTPAQYREMLALSAADMDHEAGRQWRSTEDTAVAVSLLRGSGSWVNWRRGKAFYSDGELLWLDVDTRIRQLTQGRRSLDDFERIFLGRGGNTGPDIVPYDVEELVRDLNQVVPYDWATLLHARMTDVNPHADLDGIERGGYTLVYTEHPSAAEQAASDPEDPLYVGQDFWYSLGLRVDEDGTVLDVRWQSPADVAALVPRQKLVTVNGSPYTADRLRKAVAAARTDLAPIQLTVRQESDLFPIAINYHGGERYPTLVRGAAATAYLDQITAPRLATARSSASSSSR